ncbi:MAG: hypothetical protein FJ218_06905 [Ignavibacteria bacterium]|nr:hypothetical protein [Ignavibacteria bacterium]
MDIIDEARKLLKLREELLAKEKEFDSQRLAVHNELIKKPEQSIEIDGFKISKVNDRVQL